MTLAIAAMLVSAAVLADDVSAEQALQIARQFAQSPQTQQLSRRSAPAKPIKPTMAHVMRSKESQRDNVYVVNLGNDQGFVIVSAEDGADDVVLGYCDHGSFDYDNCPIQLKDLLGSYSASVDTLRSHPAMAAPRRVVTAWPSYIGSIVVGPLLTTTWNQSWPYNMYCPKGCPTGCYPTALAQVMNYWKWPKKTVGDSEYFSNRTYDWDNMLDGYWGYNNVQAEAVAHLMADIGKAFNTAYAPEGSPTGFIYQPLIDIFGYEPGINMEQGLNASNLQRSLKKELDEHRPVLYSGYPGYEPTDIGHALVCDGYTDKDYFHFNYGWGGSCDGFYKNALVSGYACNAYIFTGVRPYDAEYKVIDGIKYGLLTNGTAEVIDYTLGGDAMKENGEVTIPSVLTDEGKEYRVTRIRKYAFYSKGKFSKITIGDNIETIERYAFILSNINEVVFGDKAKEIPDNAFANAGVRKLTIGASIKRIGKQAFSMCNVSEITCKSPAFEVDDQAFYMNSSIDKGDWLNHITKLGSRVFSGCYFLEGPSFDNLEEIGSEAFYACFFGLESYRTGSYQCTFIIPPKLKSIPTDAFSNCFSLWWFYVKDNPNFYSSGQIQPYLLNSSGTSLLMTVPKPIHGEVGENWFPFPEALVKLEPGSVRENANVIIPNTIVEMEGAFKDCTSLKNVYVRADIPPVISDSTFNNKIFENSNLVLYVPKGSSELYAKAPGWRRFRRIVEAYKWATYYPDDYEPTTPPGREYTMVVNGTDDDSQQRVSIPVSDVSSMELSDDGRQVIIKRRGGKDDVTTSVVSVDSITWKPSFVFENAEVFDLNDSTLTVEAQKCSVTFSSTCIDEDVQLSIRNGVLTPDVTDGITRGFSIDLNLSSYMWISEADMQQISDEYYADLINGEMVSVIQAIKEDLRYEASQRYKKTLEKVGAIVNTQYKLHISDSSKPSDDKSKFAGWTMRFAEIPASVGNAEEWMCTIADDGTATLGYFTVYALLQNEMPFKVVLVDRKGIERKTWDFQISEHTGKRGIKIDLAKSGVEVEAPKLMDLQLTYDPDHVDTPMTLDGVYYDYDVEKNIVKKPMQLGQQWNIKFDNSYNKRARFQKEIEKFFKRHDFITVDDAGHVKIGDDIVGTMTGNEGTGTFTINTTHKFVEKTKAEFVQGFNKLFGTGSDFSTEFLYRLNNLLNGTIKHKIDCEFHLVRNDAGSYTVTFTGTGTFNFSGENVILIENMDMSAWGHENQSITVDDVSTGITEAEGKVTLRYVVTLE